MKKTFLTHAEQLDYLVEKKGLAVPDRERAMDMLCRFGYFALIDGYKAPFKCSDGGKYRDGATFDDVVALFKMDENLRELFFKYIMRVELQLRSLISYCFTEKHGSSQEKYLDRENYIPGEEHDRDVSRVISKLRDLCDRCGSFDYINHYIEKYGTVPLWVLINALSLGVLVNLYDCQTTDIKEKIADRFGGITPSDLGSLLDLLTKFRNVSAHNERLYSARADKDICDTPLHEKYRAWRRGTQYACGKRDAFAAAIALEILLNPDDAEKFKCGLRAIVEHFLSVSKVIPREEFLAIMGFTEEYFL